MPFLPTGQRAAAAERVLLRRIGNTDGRDCAAVVHAQRPAIPAGATVEFGLIRERGATRLYGSGLISSHGDAANALGTGCARRPFTLDAVIAQPFAIDRLQDVLFEVASFDQMFEAVETLARRRRAE